MTRRTRRIFLDLTFWSSILGLASLVVCMVIANIMVSSQPVDDLVSDMFILKLVADAGGIVFLSCVAILWLHAVFVSYELLRNRRLKLFRIYLVIVGTVFAAYTYYFVDRRRLL